MRCVLVAGLYFPLESAEVPVEFRGLGLRIEDDLAFEEAGVRILSQPLPTSINELHQLRRDQSA